MQAAPPLPIVITALIEAGLRAVLANPSPTAVRVWSRDCSWGHAAYTILVTPASHPGEPYELVPGPTAWTANLPQTVEIAANGSIMVDLTGDRAGWRGTEALKPWKHEAWQVRIRLRIPETPEAGKFGVLIGETVSPPVISHPPHAWLFGPS